MAGLNHQACGVLDLASTARCPDRALLSKHSNQDEKPDLGQERDAHDRNRKEHVARRERVHECLLASVVPCATLSVTGRCRYEGRGWDQHTLPVRGVGGQYCSRSKRISWITPERRHRSATLPIAMSSSATATLSSLTSNPCRTSRPADRIWLHG